jgi:hypothetical protein
MREIKEEERNYKLNVMNNKHSLVMMKINRMKILKIGIILKINK